MLTRKLLFGIGAACMVLGGTAWACNIPVFRYALERWKPDACEVIVFHDETLSPQQYQKLEQLGQGPLIVPPDDAPLTGVAPGTTDIKAPIGAAGVSNASATGATSSSPSSTKPSIGKAASSAKNANVRLVMIRVGSGVDPRYRDLWLTMQTASQGKLPYVVVRTNVSDKQAVNAWHGPLEKLPAQTIIDSPARRELSRRLLGGDSVVWIIVQSKNAERNAAIKSLLQKELKSLSKTIPFPEGLGLPGSELYAELPLLMQFTVMEIDPSDPQEEFLVGLFRGFQPEAVVQDQPLVIPVFGRGRALEVLPADRLDAGLVGDLTRYLCGACSCQVKERNPGFDLVLSTAWDRELFGEGDLPPPPKEYDPAQAPTYVPIPSGKSNR